MFTGLSAFPLTPIDERRVDERAFLHLVGRLAQAGVDSIAALGSTGNYAYLARDERARVARLAVEAAGGIPVIVGIGALRTRDVIAHAQDAQEAGAAAVLLAPVSYQPLTDDEVFGLFEDVTAELSIPLCVYDNPTTTQFTFSDDLHAHIGALPHVTAIKIPGVPAADAPGRIAALRAVVPSDVTIGVSGDWFAAAGLSAGAQAWFSVLGGLFPETARAITRATPAQAAVLSERLEPLWVLFRRFGSLRVMAAAAALLGLTREPNLPRPLRALSPAARRELETVLATLELTG